jgi:hypothetical protein
MLHAGSFVQRREAALPNVDKLRFCPQIYAGFCPLAWSCRLWHFIEEKEAHLLRLLQPHFSTKIFRSSAASMCTLSPPFFGNVSNSLKIIIYAEKTS